MITDPRGPFRNDDEPHDADAEQCAFAAGYAMSAAEQHFPGPLERQWRERIESWLADKLWEAYEKQRREFS